MSDQAAVKFVDGSFLERLTVLETTVREMQRVNINVPNLAAIASDMGELTSGRFIAGNLTVDDSDPTNPAVFAGTGAIMDGDGILVAVGVTAVFIAVSSGTVTFYVNATDGRLYAGSGSVVLDQNGISVTGNFQKIVQAATAAGVTTTLSFGMTTDLTQEPSAIIDVSRTPSGNIIPNPNFETGSLSPEWTPSGTCTIAINTSIVHGGTYSVKFSGAAGTFGDLTQVNKAYGTAGVSYTLDYWVYLAGTPALPNVEIDFYDASLTQIGMIGISPAAVYGSWQHITQMNMVAPQGTAWIAAKCRCNDIASFTGPGDAVYFDDLSLVSQSSDVYLKIDEDVRIKARGIVLDTSSGMSVNPPTGTAMLFYDAFDRFWVARPNSRRDYIHHGFADTYAVWTADAGVKTIYNHPIYANSLGASGFLSLEIEGVLSNTGATSVSSTITIKLGSTTLFTINVQPTGTTASRHTPFHFRLVICNTGSTSAQLARITYFQSSGAVAYGTSTSTGGALFPAANTAAENTTNDVALTITQQLNTATNSKFELLSALLFGPYYGA